MPEKPLISICVCTFRRLELLAKLLESLARQETDGLFTFAVVLADNDAQESARTPVSGLAAPLDFPLHYCVEPCKNIALARNRALANATGGFVVFIDDDEFPVSRWLVNLFLTCQSAGVAGVLGPVKPHFDPRAPGWIIKGGFYDRPTHPTGFALSWPECRTGNVLFRRDILDPAEPAFRPEFGTGGEDQDFFRRMIQKGHRFIWCDEAVAFEVVPPARWSRRFLLNRALLRGRNSFRHEKGRVWNLLKSAVAVPAYALALPVLLVAGQHYFMKYLVKLADHAGRLLASVGLNPVHERPM